MYIADNKKGHFPARSTDYESGQWGQEMTFA